MNEKLRVLLLAVLGITVAAAAQDIADGSPEQDAGPGFVFHAGLRLFGGYNGYWDDDYADNFDGPLFGAGAVLAFPLTPEISVNPGLVFEYRTASYETSEPFAGGDYTVTETLTEMNLSVPVLARYAFPVGLYAEVGGLLTLNISDEYKKDDDGDVYTDDSMGRATYEFAVTAGIGWQIMKKLDVDIHASLGLNDVYDSEDPVMSPKTFQIVLGAGYWVM